MVKKASFFSLKLFCFTILFLYFAGNLVQTNALLPINSIIKNYTKVLDIWTGLDTSELLENLKDVVDVLKLCGVPISEAVSVLLDKGIEKLEPDLKEALSEYHKETMARFNSITTKMTTMKNEFEEWLSDAFYEDRILVPIAILTDFFNSCIDPGTYQPSCKATIQSQCNIRPPAGIIKYIHLGTSKSCKIPTESSFQNYQYVDEQFSFFESNKMNLQSLNFFKRREYEEAKLSFLSAILNGYYELGHLDSLTEYKLADKLNVDSVIDFFKVFSNGNCYLSSAYIGQNHSRMAIAGQAHELGLDIVRTIDLLLTCGNYTVFTDKILQKSITLINESVTNTQKYLDASLKLSWPSLFQKYAEELIPSTDLPVEQFNVTAKLILQRIHKLGLAKYNYVVFVTKFLDEDDVVYCYTSCKTENCITFKKSNVRVYLFRYINNADTESKLNHAETWFRSGAGAAMQTALNNNPKVKDMKILHELLEKAAGPSQFCNFALFHDSKYSRSNVNVSIGYSAKKFELNFPFQSIYAFFYSGSWITNQEEYFLFFFV